MQAISQLLEDWRVVALLGVLAALIIPVCHLTGTFQNELTGPIVTPFAWASPITSASAFLIARTLWRRKRAQLNGRR